MPKYSVGCELSTFGHLAIEAADDEEARQLARTMWDHIPIAELEAEMDMTIPDFRVYAVLKYEKAGRPYLTKESIAKMIGEEE